MLRNIIPNQSYWINTKIIQMFHKITYISVSKLVQYWKKLQTKPRKLTETNQ